MKMLLTAAITGFAFATVIAGAAIAPNTAGLSGSASATPVTVVAVELPAR
jgi:hypothetical protein